MRRLFPVVLCALLLSACEIIPTPTPAPTPSPFPMGPTPTFPQPTFTPLPTFTPPSPVPSLVAVTPVPAGPTVPQPGPGAGTPSGPVIPLPATFATPTITPSPTPLPATVSVRPSVGPPGTTFTALGQGWLPGEGIFLELGLSPAEPAGEVALAIADPAGQFVRTFVLPGEWPGPQQIFLIAHNLDRSRESAVPITVLPIVATPAITAWRGEYFSNNSLSGSPALVRDDSSVDFDWGEGRPASELPADWFSVRWTRTLDFLPGSYQFVLRADDGARVWVGDQEVFDEWHVSSPQRYEKNVFVPSGPQTVRVEYFEAGGGAQISLWWKYLGEYPDWRAEYYNNRDLSGAPALVRNDVDVDFDWGAGSPASEIRADNFSARWMRTLSFGEGTYRFFADADDGVQVYVDEMRIVDHWRPTRPGNAYGDVHLRSGDHRLRVDYYEEIGNAKVTVSWARIDLFPDWVAEYYPNKTLSGRPAVVRGESAIDFNWGEGSPDPKVGPEGFSARWTRTAEFDGGEYRFTVRVDDGVRLWVDDDLIIDRWHDAAGETYTARKSLTAGTHRLRLEYYENTVDALVQLSWERVE